MNEDDFVKWNNGIEVKDESIKDVPEQFNEWAKRNEDRILQAEKRKTLPYFVRDNKKLVKNLLPLTANKMAFESGRLYGFESISEFTQKSIANDIREIGNKLNIFPKNTNVHFSKNLENNTIMSWSNNTLHISCGRYKMDDSVVFCPAIDLKNAFKKLKTKGDLTFNEEYAIEALFHESVHSKIKKQPTNVLESQILEICTQLYARNNYVRILRFYNKEPLNFNAIQINGYGYKDGCNLLRKFFTKDNQLQVGELVNIANGTEDGVKKLLNKFKELNMSKQERIDLFDRLKAMIKY